MSILDPTYTKPRIVIELQDDGALVMEQWLNGSRRRTPIDRGWEVFQIKAMLDDQKAQLERDRAHKVAQQTQAAVDLHRKVYFHTRYNHGEAFADRTVGKPRTVRQSHPAAVPVPGSASGLDLDLL
jgi:hypothetical protein